jgi:ribosomal protein S12 methylthiotransferase
MEPNPDTDLLTFGRNVALRPGGAAASVPGEDLRIAFVTLGCPKNQVDSEVMLGHLDRASLRTTGDLDEADVAVVNTCAFLESAIEESIDTILDVARRKTTGRLKKLVVAGCLTQRYGRDLLEELPEVDAVMGTGDIDRVVQVVRALTVPGRRPAEMPGDPDAEWPGDRPAGDQRGRVLSTTVRSPYLKISEGCSARCTFCIIPALRGPGRSRTLEDLRDEAEHLVAAGARELVLIAQDLTAYGADLYGAPALDRLLHALDGVHGLRWIRLMYANPFHWTDALLDAVSGLDKVVPYADMPIQHITDRMLKRMGRRTDRATIEALIGGLRRRVPDIALRTNVIAGFPGETDADHRELLGFLREARFDKLVAFPYSPEDGTAAVKLPDRVSPETTRERVDAVLHQQAAISLEVNRAQIGRTLEVLIEAPAAGGGPARGRSVREAPEVDGGVWVAGTGIRTGAFYPVRVTGADVYDLIGECAGTGESGPRGDAHELVVEG